MKLSPQKILIVAFSLLAPTIAFAGAPRCNLPGVDNPSRAVCKVNPDMTGKYSISATATGEATPAGEHWADIQILVNDKPCGKKERTQAWADGPGNISTSCEIKLIKDKDYDIRAVSQNGNVKGGKVELTVTAPK